VFSATRQALLNGKPVRFCLIFAVQAADADIVTVEGLAPDPETLSLLQDSFWETTGCNAASARRAC